MRDAWPRSKSRRSFVPRRRRLWRKPARTQRTPAGWSSGPACRCKFSTASRQISKACDLRARRAILTRRLSMRWLAPRRRALRRRLSWPGGSYGAASNDDGATPAAQVLHCPLPEGPCRTVPDRCGAGDGAREQGTSWSIARSWEIIGRRGIPFGSWQVPSTFLPFRRRRRRREPGWLCMLALEQLSLARGDGTLSRELTFEPRMPPFAAFASRSRGFEAGELPA